MEPDWNREGYQRLLWKQRSSLNQLQPVLDSADRSGRKNAYLDYLQKKVIGRHLDLNGNERVLDFGCGIGRISNWLSDKAAVVVGIDTSMEMITVAGKRQARNVEYRVYNGTKIPFPDKYFDMVLSVWVMQHIVENAELERTVLEIERVLKQHGRFILIEQTSDDKGPPITAEEYSVTRSSSEYIDSIRAMGLIRRQDYPIRVGGTPLQVGNILKLPLTGGLIPMLTTIELSLARRRKTPVHGYKDHFFLFEKPADMLTGR